MNIRNTLIVCIAAFAVSACGSATKRDSAAEADRVDRTEDTRQGVGERRPGEGTALTAEQRKQQEIQELTRENVVYFEFDRAEVRPDGMRVLTRHAEFLVNNPDVRVRLEGHTDERGTREYNIGLGERRAQSVAQVLRARGVSREQLSLVSYGEERPAQLGSNEDAWAKNRRVEIVYR